MAFPRSFLPYLQPRMGWQLGRHERSRRNSIARHLLHRLHTSVPKIIQLHLKTNITCQLLILYANTFALQ